MSPLPDDDIDGTGETMKGIGYLVILWQEARQRWVGRVDQLKTTITDEAIDAIASDSSAYAIARFEDFGAKTQLRGTSRSSEASEPGSDNRYIKRWCSHAATSMATRSSVR
jgi:hypothetical protein